MFFWRKPNGGGIRLKIGGNMSSKHHLRWGFKKAQEIYKKGLAWFLCFDRFLLTRNGGFVSEKNIVKYGPAW